MSRYYDKDQLKNSLEPERIFELLEYWDGNPTLEENCIISDTICHNLPNEGSHKLYYYNNTKLFHCFTGCSDSSFDIFDLCIKVTRIQRKVEWELYDAMNYIASFFNLDGIETNDDKLKDWDIFSRYSFQIKEAKDIQLKEYDQEILSRFHYIRILPWEQEGISKEVIKENKIGYYPGKEVITIPHYDINNRLIGIRGRTLSQEDADRYGKYRPLKANKILYNHPLSLNLYHLNKSWKNIKRSKVAIILESEKAALQYNSFYGDDNDISVSCCGSNISEYQINLLRRLGCQEAIIAFDRDYLEIGDPVFQRLKNKLIHIYNRYNKYIRITAIWDKEMILPHKASPTDVSKEVFEKLLSERIVPNGK